MAGRDGAGAAHLEGGRTFISRQDLPIGGVGAGWAAPIEMSSEEGALASTTQDNHGPVEIISNSEGQIGRWLEWAKLVLGLGMAGSAGIWGGRAWSENDSLLYLPGLVSLVCGAILAVSGAQRSIPAGHHRYYHATSPQPASEGYGERELPLLGELLVHKHHLLTQEQLDTALEEQSKRGGRLGQILIAMGLLDRSQLSRVLADQAAYGDPWRETFAGPRPETAAKVGSHTG